jgi:hypothetical protein
VECSTSKLWCVVVGVPFPVPAEYERLAKTHLDASVQDVAYLYAAYTRDLQGGASQVTDFRDAVRMHRL